MKDLTLRLSTSEDEAFLFQLYKTARHEEMKRAGWNDAQADAFLHSQYMLRKKQYGHHYPNARNWIVLWQQQPIGRHLIQPEQAKWTFVDLAILPEYRNRGIGTFVFKTHLDEAIAAGATVRLSVRADSRAQDLYRRLGFVVTAEDEVYLQMEYRHDQCQ